MRLSFPGHERSRPKRTGDGFRRGGRLFFIAAFLLVAILNSARPARGQDWLISSSPAAARHEARAREILDGSRDEVVSRLGLPLGGPVEVEIAGDPADFVNRVHFRTGGQPPDWALAVAEARLGVVVIDGSKIRTHENNLAVTLRHELVHIALGRLQQRSHRRIPRWAEEGLAEWVGGSILGPDDVAWLEGAAQKGGLIPFRELEQTFPPHGADARQAYVEAHAFILYLVGKEGPAGIRSVLQEMGRGTSFAESVRTIFGAGPADLEREWQESMKDSPFWVLRLLDSIGLWGVLALVVVLGWYLTRLRNRKALEEMDRYDY